jgi:hypothetical protein
MLTAILVILLSGVLLFIGLLLLARRYNKRQIETQIWNAQASFGPFHRSEIARDSKRSGRWRKQSS